MRRIWRWIKYNFFTPYKPSKEFQAFVDEVGLTSMYKQMPLAPAWSYKILTKHHDGQETKHFVLKKEGEKPAVYRLEDVVETLESWRKEFGLTIQT